MISGKTLFTCDDRLELRGRLSIAGKEENWREVCTLGPYTGKWMRAPQNEGDGWEILPEAEVLSRYGTELSARVNDWMPNYTRVRKLSGGWGLEIKNGDQIRMTVAKLYTQPKHSRYRLMAQAVAELAEVGVLRYEGQENLRHRLEAMRHRLKGFRRIGNHTEPIFVVGEYEHCLLFQREIGLELLAELRASNPQHTETNTVYMKGYESDTALLVKCYDMLEKHGSPFVKLEVTLRKDWLKADGHPERRRPEKWLFAPDIQDWLRKTLMREYRAVLDRAPKTRAKLEAITETERNGQPLLDFMLVRESTLTEIVKRIDDIDRRVKVLEADKKRGIS